jgi:hypothetical protein
VSAYACAPGQSSALVFIVSNIAFILGPNDADFAMRLTRRSLTLMAYPVEHRDIERLR